MIFYIKVLYKFKMLTLVSASGYITNFKDGSCMRLYLDEVINMLHGGYYLDVEDEDPIFHHLLLGPRDGPEFRDKVS